jgi:hypothetical protein
LTVAAIVPLGERKLMVCVIGVTIDSWVPASQMQNISGPGVPHVMTWRMLNEPLTSWFQAQVDQLSSTIDPESLLALGAQGAPPGARYLTKTRSGTDAVPVTVNTRGSPTAGSDSPAVFVTVIEALSARAVPDPVATITAAMPIAIRRVRSTFRGPRVGAIGSPLLSVTSNVLSLVGSVML